MAIHFLTPDASLLLQAIKAAIEDGTIESWNQIPDGFTHSRLPWSNEAYLLPRLLPDELRLTIVPLGVTVSVETYAILHGRFIEMALAHFDKLFSLVSASALPEEGDLV